jgi:hypothetical protein
MMGNKAYYANRQLSNSSLISRNSKLQIYRTLVRPVVSCGSEVVCNKTKRKTKNEMAGRRVQGSEKDGGERMERQSKKSRKLEAHCKGGQGPPRAVAPSKKKKKKKNVIFKSQY